MDSKYLSTDSDASEREQDVMPATEERRYRAIGIVALLCIGAVGLVLFSASNVVESHPVHRLHHPFVRTAADSSITLLTGFSPSRLVLSHVRILDTIYTTDSIYLDVDLSRQHVTVINRNGSRASFPISSGNKSIKDAIATPTGVFTVQSKTPLAISKQFKNAKLYWWVGVQGGVGFHGLDGNGYYWNLGKRPSSHGCIRMAREDVQKMYGMVHSGALIRVHDGDPARVVQFCRPGDTLGALVIDSAAVHNRNLGRARFHSIMAGLYWTNPQPRLVHLAGRRFRWGMEIGQSSKIPTQKLPESMLLRPLPMKRSMVVPDRSRPSTLDAWDLDAARIADSLDERDSATWEAEKKSEPEYGE